MHDGLLDGFPVVIELPIQWGEMDAYGHVNNTVFFRFFESARIAFLDRCGFLGAYEELKVGAILHSTSCRFRRPLFYPDTISIGARATEVAEDRFVMEYKIVSHAQNAVAADGRARWFRLTTIAAQRRHFRRQCERSSPSSVGR